ncbi:MAG: translocation/assembly module TamB domain-containing protein [Chthoniobacteraceae bacterium]
MLRGAAWALLALLVLHWPLIIFGAPIAARIFARKQHLDVSFALGGTVWTSLTITDLRASPRGDGATPVESIRIEKLRFDYSLWRLAREGVGEFLSSYELRHADLAFIALPSQTHEEREVKKSVIESLRAILSKPAAFSDRVLIDDFSIRVRSPESETVVRGIDALFDPRLTGYLRIARVQIPGLPVWENLSAETSYANRNLVQRGMRLGPDIVIDELRYDASRRTEGRGLIALVSHGFGGELSVTLTGEEKKHAKGEFLEHSYDTRLQVAIAGVRVREAAEYFGVKGVPIERLAAFDLDFTGDPEKPHTWGGTIKTSVENLTAGSIAIPHIEFTSDFANGTAKTRGGVQFGPNTIALDSRIALPGRIDDWFASGVDATARIEAPDLAAFASTFAPGVTAAGSFGLDATLGFHERKATVKARFQARDIAADQVATPAANGDIAASVRFAPDNSIQLSDLDAEADITLGPTKLSTFTIDGARVALTASKGYVTVREFALKRGANTISATGRVQLPADAKTIADTPGELQLTVQAPNLGEFGIDVNGRTLGGKLDTQASVQFARGNAEGQLQLGGAISLGDFALRKLTARARFRDHAVQLEEFTVALNDNDQLSAKGRFDFQQPQLYEATLALGIRDLAVLDPLLAVFDVKEPIKGALDLRWSGKGALKAGQNDGDAGITLKGARYGAIELDDFSLTGSYTADTAKAELRATSGPTRLATQIAWENDRVSLRDLELVQGGQRALTGEISYGLAGLGGAEFDPLTQSVAVSLQADKLDLEPLLAGFVKPAPASGRVTLHLAAQGTPLRPQVELKIEGRALKAKAVPQFDAAELDLALNYQPGALTLDAAVRQPLIRPLIVKARAPLDVEKLAAAGKLDPALPLDVSIQLPPTSLAVLPKLAPAIRRIDGTIALDVHAGGTVEKPQLSGAATIDLKDARMANESVPAIGKFDARLAFADDTLRFERFAGEIGGGTFDLGGSIGLTDLQNPAFDLQLKADDVLAMRNDAITVRADADIKIGGALKAGSVTGEVFVTQSRFFKEIDILPIGLPGKPKPAPKSAPSAPDISLPPPLDAWTFDVAIKTRADDPFRVLGNLANGRVALNLQLGGDGRAPWLDGDVTIEQFTGTLPFSTITIDNGHVYFTKAAPFEPTLDLHAQSRVRSYTVGADIFGKATEPQLHLTSEPPLPHADIVSLLATGTTTSELTGSADVLASRAAMLAVSSLWKKIFKSKGASAAPPPPKKGDAGFADRFQLELGSVDQKTGAREATAKFKVNDQTYILGELDTQGRYTGSVKYLLRFR